ncbi:hypothetical protein [Botrimarina mediterranea]|uniref:hypothetical protein n=1 Tax=Botrimarina mediterranea TaxID=2528022 RepID=UPI0011888C11|nr:hypothetical protein K2D_16950 [Planctomycetes bacterium K2D]
MEVIREVVIRGRMEIVKADLQVPDISAFTKITEESNRLQKELFERVNAVAQAQEEAARQATERIAAEKQAREEAAKSRAEAKAAAEEKKKQREAEKAAIEAAKKAEKEAADQARKLAEAEAQLWEQTAAEIAAAEKAKQDAIDATNRAREEAIRREREINDSLLKSGDALKQAGDGAFAFARGLTLVGFEGSDSMEEVARAVASVQGKFDLFRGSIDILKGGVESARALGKAMELSGGPVSLLTSRFSALTGFLGPTGLVAAGTVAAAAAIHSVFSILTVESEAATDRAERNLRDFISRSERLRARAQNEFERDDAIRSRMTAEQQIASSRQALGGLGEGREFNITAEQQERRVNEQRLREIAEIRRITLGQESLSDRDVAMLDQQAQERQVIEMRQQVIDPAKRKAEIEEELKKASRREGLSDSILSGVDNRNEAADRERTANIRDAEGELEQRQDRLKTAQEKLAEEQAKRQEMERQAAAERARMSVPDRAFYDRVTPNIGDEDAVSKEMLERLMKMAPSMAGQIRDEFTRRETGVEVTRPDTVAQAQATVKALEQATKDAAEQLRKKLEEDKKLDEAAAAERQANIDLANAATEAVFALKKQLDDLTRELNQGG